MVDVFLEEVAPDEVVEFTSAAIQRIRETYGCVVAIADDTKIQAKGTGIFVALGGRALLVTAEHVVSGLRARGGTPAVLIPSYEDGPVDLEGFAEPRTFPLDLANVVWASESMDVAVLEAPAALAEANHVRFLEADRHAGVTSNLRKLWRGFASEESTLPFVVLGYPNFGHLEDQVARVEVLGALPLLANITALEEHRWEGAHVGPFPQMHLDLVAEPTASERADLNDLERTLRARLLVDDAEWEAFGGYSGGPVFLLANDGEYLVGVVHEGRRVFGKAVAHATAWDDVFQAMKAGLGGKV